MGRVLVWHKADRVETTNLIQDLPGPVVRSDRAGVGVENRSRGMSPMFLATLSIADHDGMRGFPCRAASQPHQHPLHTYA